MHLSSLLKSTRNLTLVYFAGISGLLALHPSRGLWVGEVSLNQVNEATGAVGDSNTYEFTDPDVTTTTSDTAYLRLILHVNGAGQVNLLKSVAVVETDNVINGFNEIVLLTNPELYPDYSGIAKRVSSAFFDFGDPQAAAAVQVLIDEAVGIAVTQALAGEPRSAIEAAIQSSLDGIVAGADVDLAYFNPGAGSSFITDSFFSEADVETIANKVAELIDEGTKTAADFNYTDTSVSYAPFPTDPLGATFGDVVTAAEALRDASFYGDTRGIDAIVNIVVAAAVAVDAMDPAEELADKQASARAAAIADWHNAADLEQAYNRFLATSEFSALQTSLISPAVEAALTSEAEGDNEAAIRAEVESALRASDPVPQLIGEAATILAGSYFGDTRAQLALDALILAATDAATAQVLISTDEIDLTDLVEAALVTANEGIDAAPVFASSPSDEYTEFVAGSLSVPTAEYETAAALAAEAASSEAFFQVEAGVDHADALTVLTNRAVSKALIGIRNQAAALPQNEVPLSGELTEGSVVSGSFILPAQAPTNPFIHRLHPDHGSGIDITRHVAIAVDAPDGGSETTVSGYGVSVLQGTYSEEIFGLHKPLGDDQDIGLKTSGSFVLNRLTLADTLNF